MVLLMILVILRACSTVACLLWNPNSGWNYFELIFDFEGTLVKIAFYKLERAAVGFLIERFSWFRNYDNVGQFPNLRKVS